MANHKSSKKRIRQTAAKRAHNRLYHKTARNAVKALRQHLGEECRRSPAPQGNHHAGQARQAQYRAQEQGRKPEERPPAARERTLIRPDAKPEAAPVAAFFILLRKATVSASVPPARAQHTHTLRHTRHTPLPSHGARPREQLPRRPARHGIQTILPAFPHKAQDTRHTLRTPHLVPEYALYDKAARIAADGFRFSPPGHPRAALPFPGIP